MAPVALVILLAVLQFLVFGWLVARARARYGIKAPATTGHEVFERWFRVQQNTLEMLIAFIPAISLFAIYVNPNWAAWVGLVYIVGRAVYVRAYVADPARWERERDRALTAAARFSYAAYQRAIGTLLEL